MRRKNTYMQGISVLIIGLCLGWLMGLSKTELIKDFITTILLLVSSIVSLMVGLYVKEDKSIEKDFKLKYEMNPLPLALLIIGISIGAPTGIHVRDHGLLSPSVEEAKNINPSQLFNLNKDECKTLLSLDGEKLKIEFKTSSVKYAEEILNKFQNTKELKNYIKDELCKNSK